MLISSPGQRKRPTNGMIGLGRKEWMPCKERT